MKSLFTFYFAIDYRSPSKKEAFLDVNWGIMDVRGPYMTGTLKVVKVDSRLLLLETSSSINFVLSVSNRCPARSVLVLIFNKENSVANYINKNESFDFTFSVVYRDPSENTSLYVKLPELTNLLSLKEFIDIVSIDEIKIERFR